MILLIFCDCFLYAGGYKEVLLFQTQLFTCHMVIIRIKYFYQVAGKVLLLDSLLILTFVEAVKLKRVHCLCIPDT